MATNELLGSRYAAQYKLKDFLGVAPEYTDKLKSIGIRTVEQMLKAGRTVNERKNLAEKTGVTLGTIVEIVKLSDLSRIPGLRKVRDTLYFEAGLDTVEK